MSKTLKKLSDDLGIGLESAVGTKMAEDYWVSLKKPSEDNFCLECQDCGHIGDMEDNFCRECGTKFIKDMNVSVGDAEDDDPPIHATEALYSFDKSA